MSDAETLWNFLNIRQEPKKADCILVLGSHDIRIARYAATLYHEGKAQWIILSGGNNEFTSKIYPRTEAEAFSAEVIRAGVPPHRVIIENLSSNTAENFIYTKKLLSTLNLEFNSFIVLQVPNMLMRVKATGQKYLANFQVSTHPITFQEATHEHLPEEFLFHELTGDIQRLIIYPKLGFHHEINIPDDVMSAWERMIEKGYTGNLVSSIDR